MSSVSGVSGVSSIYSRLSSDYYIADIALEYLNDDTLIVLSTQSKHFKDKAYNLLFKRQQHKIFIDKYCKKLTIIPKEIKYIRNLEELFLSRNQIQEIPETIGQLTNLKLLYLSCNLIQEIPKSIGQLTNFTHLSLYNNQIRKIPETIERLTNLKYLNLSNNKIREMPDLSHLINCIFIK